MGVLCGILTTFKFEIIPRLKKKKKKKKENIKSIGGDFIPNNKIF